MKTRSWNYIGGNIWSLVEKLSDDLYEKHIVSVEVEKGKYPYVIYVDGTMDKDDLQGLLDIVKEEI